MARPITSPELTALRGAGQFSRLYLAIHKPTIVFQAQLNGTPSSLDQVVTLPYHNVQVGAFSSILPHMTLLVGTAQSGAGMSDKGIIRIRKAADATNLYIGETSEVEFLNNDWLTVVNEFSPFQRHVRIDAADNNRVYMDWDTNYTNQHENFNPVPVMGPHAAGFLSGGSLAIQFDATDSWVPGDTIASYAWSVTGSATINNPAIVNPTITFTVAGTYRVSLLITSTTGAKTTTGYRYVFVYSASNRPYEDFTLTSLAGNTDSGGWQMEINAYGAIDQTVLRDQVLVILFSRDYYQGVEGSLSPVNDRENILFIGWVDGETIMWDADYSEVAFTAKGPHHWLNKMTGYPVGVEDTELPDPDVSPSWTAMSDLTVGKGLFHFLYWRSTLCFVTDVYRQTDTRQVGALEAPLSSLWQQLFVMAYNTLLAKPLCDRYARLFTEIDPQFVPEANRSSIPTVQTIATQDWYDRPLVQRRPADEVGYLEVSGVAYSNGVGTPICTRAYGSAIAHHGRVERHERLALVDNAQAVQLTGLLMGQLNNQFPLTTTRLASNHRFFDIAPQQYALLDMASADTIRGFDISQRLIPRRVSHSFEDGVMLTDVQFEAETFEQNAILTTCPEMPDLPPFQPADPPTWPPIPPAPTWTYLVIAYDRRGSPFTEGQIYISGDFFTASSPHWQSLSSGISTQDLGRIHKIVADVRSATEVRLYALALRVRGGDALGKLYRMDNLLTNPTWNVADSFQRNSSPAGGKTGDLPASFCISGANPNHVYSVGVRTNGQLLAGNCLPSETFFPTRFVWTDRNSFGVGLSPSLKLSDTLACIGPSSAQDYRTNLIDTEQYHIEPIGVGWDIASNANGDTVAIAITRVDIETWGGEPDVEGPYYNALRALGGGNSFSLTESVRIKPAVGGTNPPGAWVRAVANGSTFLFSYREVGDATQRIFRSTNTGVSFSQVDSFSASNAFDTNQGVDISDDGTQAMHPARKSSDGGATWGAHSAYNSQIVAKAVRRVPGADPNLWVIGGESVDAISRGILYSNDFGVSWVDKTGTGMKLGPNIRYIEVLAVPS